MTGDIEEDDRQFERVLSRLDALMKHSHVSVPADGVDIEAAVDVPVLTEVYRGEELVPLAVVDQDDAPLLTESIRIPESVVADVAEAPEQVPPTREQEVEMVVAELMPMLRDMVAEVVREELQAAQQSLSARVGQEAERLLRQRLLQGSKLK